MMWRDTVKLLKIVYDYNEYNEPIETTYVEREVFANKKSVRQSEFYQALAAGMKAEIMFEVRMADYEGELRLKYGDKVYDVTRTYERNGEIIELVCAAME